MLPRLLLVLCTVLAAQLLFASPAAATHYDYLLAPTTSCTGQTDLTATRNTQEWALGCLVNYARKKVGRSALTWKHEGLKLHYSSLAKVGDIRNCGFSHTACGRSITYWFNYYGYRWCAAGENLHWRSSGGTARYAMSAFLHSDSHRPNMLSSNFRDMGIGLHYGSFAGYPNASVWVQHFGRAGC